MAKTITRLDESDIDFKGNPLHATLSGGLAVAALLLTSPAKEGEDQTARTQRVLVQATVMFLNLIEESGYTLTKKEDIPSAFTRPDAQ